MHIKCYPLTGLKSRQVPKAECWRNSTDVPRVEYRDYLNIYKKRYTQKWLKRSKISLITYLSVQLIILCVFESNYSFLRKKNLKQRFLPKSNSKYLTHKIDNNPSNELQLSIKPILNAIISPRDHSEFFSYF